MAWKHWKDTAIEKAREHIVLGLFGLITLLLLVIYQAVPASTWGKVSELVPKRVLWALIALELIVIGLQAGFALDTWRQKKPKAITAFNIHWDSDFNQLCPMCDIHLPITDRIQISTGTYEMFGCPKCRTLFQLYDDFGHRILLIDAKSQLKSGAIVPLKRK